MYSINDIKAILAYWEGKPDSPVRRAMLKYWGRALQYRQA